MCRFRHRVSEETALPLNKEESTNLINIMEFLIWIVFGAIAGWIASMIMKTNGSQGLLLDIIVGIVGAVLGGWIMNMFGQSGVGGFNLYSFLVAILGAVVLLAIVKMVRRA